jgi:hypothetical protein
MAISHELSSEIADALFAAKDRSPHELNDLKEIVFKIHSTLEQLTDEDLMARRSRATLYAPEAANSPDVTGPTPAKSKSAGQDS